MGLETGEFLVDLDLTWPVGGDGLIEGDNHIRLTKKILKRTFPGQGGQGFAKAINASEDELNFSVGVSSLIQDQLDALQQSITDNGSVPIGGIIMYNGAFVDIADNFQLCDGTNGTPDLTKNFVYGTNTELEIGSAGGDADGVASHTHPDNFSTANDSHNHQTLYNQRSTNSNRVSSVNPMTSEASAFGDNDYIATPPDTSGRVANIGPTNTDTHSHTVNGGVLSSGTTDGNIPPYIKLAYIRRMT